MSMHRRATIALATRVCATVASDPQQLAAIQRQETRKWGEVICRAGIHPET